LVKLMRICPEHGKIASEIQCHADVVHAQRVREALEGLLDDLVKVDLLPLRRVLASQRKEVLHDPPAPNRRLVEPRHPQREGAALQLGLEEARSAHDHGEWIVQLVSDACEERCQGRKLVALMEGLTLMLQLLRRPFFLGDVLLDGNEVRDGTVLIAHRRHGLSLGIERAILATIHEPALPGTPGSNGGPQGFVRYRVLLPRLQHARRLAHRFARLVSGQSGEGGVDPLDHPIRVRDDNGIGGRL
jgi:hypothetical protein